MKSSFTSQASFWHIDEEGAPRAELHMMVDRSQLLFSVVCGFFSEANGLTALRVPKCLGHKKGIELRPMISAESQLMNWEPENSLDFRELRAAEKNKLQNCTQNIITWDLGILQNHTFTWSWHVKHLAWPPPTTFYGAIAPASNYGQNRRNTDFSLLKPYYQIYYDKSPIITYLKATNVTIL